MRSAFAPWLVLGVLAAAPALGERVVLQNDSFTGSFTCHAGIDEGEAMAAKFTAQPAHYPYTIHHIQVLGCGSTSGSGGSFAVDIYHDDGGTANPGTLIYHGTVAYALSGANVFNEIDLSQEGIPAIASGAIRVSLARVLDLGGAIGFGADTNGITSHNNYVRSPLVVWSFAENQGVTGDWILRLGIEAASPVQLQRFEID